MFLSYYIVKLKGCGIDLSLNYEIDEGDLIEVRLPSGEVLKGIVMPSTEFSSKDILIIKLDNGYNVGVCTKGAIIRVLRKGAVSIGKEPPMERTVIRGKGEAKVLFLSTGGTIMSRVEYETGAVRPAINATELTEMVPNITELVSEIHVMEMYRLLSENLTPNEWSKIATEVGNAYRNGFDSVVIAHGTDTMAYTSAAIAFAVKNAPGPTIFVGAQRSSDRPSTDAVLNLRASFITACKAPFAESVVAMHGTTSDTYVLIHRGVKVRKMHSSRRDAFQSINDYPLAKVIFPKGELKIVNNRYIERTKDRSKLDIKPRFSNKAFLLKMFPGMPCDIIDYVVDRGYKAIVIEGTGLGHIRDPCIEAIKRATELGVVVVMTTQTLFGRVNMKVYTTGRKLIKAGVLSADDMLPEVALVKLSWLLGNYGDDVERIKELFLTNLVNEINSIHDHKLYPRWYHGD